MISPIIVSLVPTTVISLLWVAIATDLTKRRIPNWISAGVISLFLIYCMLNFGQVSLAYHLVWAFVTFLGLFCVFAMGQIGGGDVKLSTAVMLWAGPDQGMRFLFITAIAGGVLALVMLAPLILHQRFGIVIGKDASRGQQGGREPLSVPYGLAISLAGTVCLYDGFLTREFP